MMETSLMALLVGYAPLAALVGNRIYWDEIPQGTVRPCIVMFVVSSTPGYTFEGADPLVPVRVQIDCQVTTASSAKVALAKTVNDLLSGYKGTVGGTKFSGIFQLLTRDRTDKPASGSTIRTRQMDYEVWAKPAA
jgi:hypothetical protein